MKKVVYKNFALFCAVLIAIGAMPYLSKAEKSGLTPEEEIEIYHMKNPTPTRLLMRLISAHTSKILNAIMVGDFNNVGKEANAVAENSKVILDNFFPQGGQVGEWFKETGKNPNDPQAVKAMKEDFEKYLKTVHDSAKNVAETAKKQDIVTTYKSFDAMLTKACFACHEMFRPKWPEWPEWMKITGG